MTLEQLCVHGWVMDRCSDCASPILIDAPIPADSADLTRPPFPCPTPWTCGPNLCTGGCGGDPSLRATEVVYAHADHCETLARQCLALITALRSTRQPDSSKVLVDREDVNAAAQHAWVAHDDRLIARLRAALGEPNG